MSNNNENERTLEEKINYISNESTLINFLSKNQIADVKQIYELQHYQKDDDRRGIIIETQEKNSSGRTKILIDLKIGEPTVNQVYDSLYEIGKDCSIKIIMFTGHGNENDLMIPIADEYAVNSLIDQLQQSNVGILLSSIYEDKMKVEDHHIYDYWKQVNQTGKVDLPTEEEFMMTTFWDVYFDSFSGEFYEPWEAYGSISTDKKDCGFTLFINGIRKGLIELYWDENGVRYEIKQHNYSEECLKRILDIDLPDLQERYGADSVKFENSIGRLPKLYIKYSDIPFSWLYTATPRKITDFAHRIFTDAWDLREKMELEAEKLFEIEPAMV